MSQSFANLGLMADLVNAVADEGYTQPTPVQIQAIPVILQGRDVLAGAQTGTGKTAGFTLPMLQRLAHHANASTSPAKHPVRALVLTPTRELAAQVEESVRTYGKNLSLKTTLIYGGVNINPQIQALRAGVDILVATPGRLLDHVEQKTVNLSHVEILVLDEADRMLDMGFIRDIRKILALLPKKRQNLLFSATFTDEIRELASGILHDPAEVQVARRNAESELVAQRVHPVAKERKRALLSHLVGSGDWKQVLVFTRTKHGANRLAEQLCKDGIEATAIHGNKSQPARTKALAGFKEGTVRVLVATDIAARGLDIEELPHVVNYELPNVPEDYVHRIGRTGRAGSTGEAISLVSPDEHAFLADIEKLMKRRVEREVVPGFEPGAPIPEAERTAAQADRGSDRPEGRRGGGRGGQRREGGRDGSRDGRQRDRSRQPGAGAPAQAQGEPRRDDDQDGNRAGAGNERRREGNRTQGAAGQGRDGNRGRGAAGGRRDGAPGQRRDRSEGGRSGPPRGNRGQSPMFAGYGKPVDLADRPYEPAEAPVSAEAERQPESNAGQLFPSSARVFGDPNRDAGRGQRRGRRGPPPALLGGNNNRRSG